MPEESTAQADAIEADLRAIGSPDRAVQEKQYLKSDLEFLGAGWWEVGRYVKEFARTHTTLDHEELVSLVTALWSEPIHERRAAAEMLLERYRHLISPADLELVERLIRESKTWALVDGLAATVTGDLLLAHPEAVAPVIDRWATDADFWVRRSALLAELTPLKRGAAFDRFGAHADTMLEEREFFIRKAIGWILREMSKKRPQEVIAWLEPRTHRASGVTMREAVKYLPPPDGQRLMAAYRERRPAD